MEECAEISVGRGIGPYQIGMPAGNVLVNLDIPVLEAPYFSMPSPSIVSYYDKDKSLVVDVDIRVGLCFQVIAKPGFAGQTSLGIRLGMKASDALQLDKSLYLDGFYGTLQSRDFPGYYLELEDPDPLPEEFENFNITGIGVTDPSFFRALEISDLSSIDEMTTIRDRMLQFYLTSFCTE